VGVLYYLAVALYVVVCLFLIIVVLLQPGKAGGATVFGAGSSTGSVFGGRGASTILSKATTVAAGLFMILSIILARASSDTSAIEGTAPKALPGSHQKAETPDTKGPDKGKDGAKDSAKDKAAPAVVPAPAPSVAPAAAPAAAPAEPAPSPVGALSPAPAGQPAPPSAPAPAAP
jgi:preprotein translocase subunit SecG